ncbi:hypothetical protein EYF80_021699 [Liparis tanakae]|uniref:Uncharacterized protein n=1 Tax=Liparis tanakae TaxID=230148 RepID=A0A4Z2HSS2_9TELE|nr:hypothetical protein EYF80_021699 [Liparis tanakae]
MPGRKGLQADRRTQVDEQKRFTCAAERFSDPLVRLIIYDMHPEQQLKRVEGQVFSERCHLDAALAANEAGVASACSR